MLTVRPAAVAGSFYEDDPERLRASMEECFLHRLGPGRRPEVVKDGPRRIVGLVCPHAGFQYSGAAAAWAYEALARDGRPDTVVLLGTNHRLTGAPASLSPAHEWATPLGRLRLDDELCAALRAYAGLQEDDLAHEFEHSIEVQLPWLQFLYGDNLQICPISLGHLRPSTMQGLAETLAQALASRNAVIIASSDFSHYVPQETARELDRAALDKIAALEAEELLAVVEETNITMCGVVPVAVMLAAARRLGGAQGRVLTYYTSGDIAGDRRAVVGYAAVAIEKG